MPSLEFFVVTNSISADQRSNRLSIFEILEDLAPIRFPAVIPRLYALTIWTLEQQDQGQDLQAVLRITGAGEPNVREFRQNFTADGPTQRMLFHLVGVPVTAPGIILFEIFLNNGQRKASHQIRVAGADAAIDDDGFLVYEEEDTPPETEKQGGPAQPEAPPTPRA